MSPFTTLGLAVTATPAEVKMAFRTRLRQVHPDLIGEAGHAVTIGVLAAYEQALAVAQAKASTTAASSRVMGFVPAPHRACGDATPRNAAFVASTFRVVA